MLGACNIYNKTSVLENYNYDAKLWNVAIYVRLSREDDNSGQSESIENQIKFLTAYVKQNEWNLIKIYSDDGYTGTNFERPAFKEMIQDIELGLINLVITKDLSRLGRDHIDTSHYIERYFPEKNIRYIAINDNVDTFDPQNSNNEMTPFKAVVNDFYARDISKKVKTALITKAIDGECTKPFQPYGYKKDQSDKNKIVVDEVVAGNVVKIFELYHSGMCKQHICNYLEKHKVITPLKYKELTTNYKNPNPRTYMWNTATISKILKDRTYIGDLVQNKSRKVNYKVKRRIQNSPEQYIVVSNNHKAIIDKKVFYTVQDKLEKQTNEWTYLERPPHLLKGLAFCSCGARITYNKNHGKYMRCICSSYKRNGAKFCSSVHMREDELIKTVIDSLRDKIQRVLKQNEFNYNEVGAGFHAYPDNTKIINKKIAEINNMIKNVYEDKVRGIISEDMFITLSKDYEKQKKKLLEQLKLINKPKQENANINIEEFKKVVNDILKLEKPEEVDRNLLNKLIKKIVINDNHITVEYKFKSLNN